MIKIQHLLRALVVICAFSLGSTAFAQWAGGTATNVPIYRDGSVAIGKLTPAITTLDVRGNNIYLAPSGSASFSNKFCGIGESGGQCNIYGFRAQTKSQSYITVGVRQPDGPISKPMDIEYNPVISWGDSAFSPIPCPFPQTNCTGLVPRPLEFEYDGTDDDCGDVVVAMYSPNNSFQFRIFGQGIVNGSFITSDRRYKTNINNLEGALNTVSQLRGVSYAFNQEKFPEFNLPNGRTNGFIAQEVMEVMPEIVGTDDNGYHSVNYDAVVPLLVEAVKEQKEIVENQDAEIQNLKNELAEIKAMLAGNNSTKFGGQSGMGSDMGDRAELFQNRPNPTNGYTNIPFYLPSTATNAQIRITAVDGRVIDVINVSERGQGEVRIESASMEAGVYLYTLEVDGEVIGNKRMVISK